MRSEIYSNGIPSKIISFYFFYFALINLIAGISRVFSLLEWQPCRSLNLRGNNFFTFTLTILGNQFILAS